MIIAKSIHGISVLYRCCNAKYMWFRKCPNKSNERCIRCQYCKAEMAAEDATRLLNRYDKQVKEKQDGNKSTGN